MIVLWNGGELLIVSSQRLAAWYTREVHGDGVVSADAGGSQAAYAQGALPLPPQDTDDGNSVLPTGEDAEPAPAAPRQLRRRLPREIIDAISQPLGRGRDRVTAARATRSQDGRVLRSMVARELEPPVAANIPLPPSPSANSQQRELDGGEDRSDASAAPQTSRQPGPYRRILTQPGDQSDNRSRSVSAQAQYMSIFLRKAARRAKAPRSSPMARYGTRAPAIAGVSRHQVEVGYQGKGSVRAGKQGATRGGADE